MNLFKLFATLSLDDSGFNRDIEQAEGKAKGFSGKLSSALGKAAKITAGIGAAFVGVAGGAVAALNGLAESTEEYRIEMGKLNTAFEAAGMSQETANKAYTEFFSILGETDTAVEASQLLAQLAQSEEDVAEWTRIATGVLGTFGDALPVESLIEAA